ncbi:MAG: hypothetical protein K6G30_11130 [Acetatifactor sp.]|nr:hypothetical protein [Acetatifactor sp.]
MDINGIQATNGGTPLAALPMGFGMALAMNEAAMKNYAQMTETEREHVIMRCKDAKSKEEMRRLVEELVPDGNRNTLYEHNENGMQG